LQEERSTNVPTAERVFGPTTLGLTAAHCQALSRVPTARGKHTNTYTLTEEDIPLPSPTPSSVAACCLHYIRRLPAGTTRRPLGLRIIDSHIADYLDEAQLRIAA
jgi:hypothetical protein